MCYAQVRHCDPYHGKGVLARDTAVHGLATKLLPSPAPSGLLAVHVAATGPCTQQLLDTGIAPSLAANIDAETPATACSRAICTSTKLAGCGSGASENLILVMSDEFNKEDRGLGVYQNDPMWTAENVSSANVWDGGTRGTMGSDV